jgi:hypothetical protein
VALVAEGVRGRALDRVVRGGVAALEEVRVDGAVRSAPRPPAPGPGPTVAVGAAEIAPAPSRPQAATTRSVPARRPVRRRRACAKTSRRLSSAIAPGSAEAERLRLVGASPWHGGTLVLVRAGATGCPSMSMPHTLAARRRSQRGGRVRGVRVGPATQATRRGAPAIAREGARPTGGRASVASWRFAAIRRLVRGGLVRVRRDVLCRPRNGTEAQGVAQASAGVSGPLTRRAAWARAAPVGRERPQRPAGPIAVSAIEVAWVTRAPPRRRMARVHSDRSTASGGNSLFGTPHSSCGSKQEAQWTLVAVGRTASPDEALDAFARHRPSTRDGCRASRCRGGSAVRLDPRVPAHHGIPVARWPTATSSWHERQIRLAPVGAPARLLAVLLSYGTWRGLGSGRFVSPGPTPAECTAWQNTQGLRSLTAR